MASWRCRWCRGGEGEVVLDLGAQPPAGLLPAPTDPLPDPVEPLRMVMCAACRLAQLEDDGSPAVEAAGTEPVAMVEQGRQMVAALGAAGLLRPGATYREFTSPHGGSWSAALDAAGARAWSPVEEEPPDVVIDVFGLMHEADVAQGWCDRVGTLGHRTVLVVQYHSLAGDLRTGTWHTLRPGHFAYFSAPVLLEMARSVGLRPVGAWETPLQGGTGVMAFADAATGPAATSSDDAERVAAADRAAGVEAEESVRALGTTAGQVVAALRDYVAESRARGLDVAGYGAASRTPTILTLAGIDAAAVALVADASAAKQGRCLPVGRVPVVSPEELDAARPDRVVLFVPELLDEVRRTCPAVEAHGGRWVVLDPFPVEIEVSAAATVDARERETAR